MRLLKRRYRNSSGSSESDIEPILSSNEGYPSMSTSSDFTPFSPPTALIISGDSEGMVQQEPSPLSFGLLSPSSTLEESPNHRDINSYSSNDEQNNPSNFKDETMLSPSSYKSARSSSMENNEEKVQTFDEYSSVRDVLIALAVQQGEQNAQIQSGKQNTKPNDSTTSTRSKFHPISIALGFLEGLGSVFEQILQLTCGDINDDESSSIQTYQYERDQLLYHINRVDRLNSFDTFGTLNTVGTVNTMTSQNTTGTNHTTGSASIGVGTVDDDGNVIPAALIKDHLIRKQVADKLNESSSIEIQDRDTNKSSLQANNENEVAKKREKMKRKKKMSSKRKKVVGFEYPPISTMREVPRVSSVEKRQLFFTDEELDNYSDNFSSMTEESDCENENSNSVQLNITKESIMKKGIISPTSSALRHGKFSPEKKHGTPPVFPLRMSSRQYSDN